MFEQAITSTKIIRTESLSFFELDRLILYLGGQQARVCVITGGNPFPLRDYMLASLRKLRRIEVLNKVSPDPKVSDVMAMVNALKRKNINLIVGIGGGSTLDSAKAVAAILSNGGDLSDYLGAEATRRIEKKEVRLMLIPTTAGTGSEVTQVGVYTSSVGRKHTLGHPLMQADVAVLVAGYLQTLPPELTAATAFDALSHAFETLWNRNATPLSDRAAIESAVHLLSWMEIAYKSSFTGGMAGRAEMLKGACMAGTAFNLTGTAAVHALSFIFSEEWHVPHGVACAFTLEDIFRLNIQDESTRQKFVQLTQRLYATKDITSLLDTVIRLKKQFELPFTFKDLQIELSEDRIGELFYKTLDDPKMKNNIVPIGKDFVYELIRSKL